MPGKPPAIKRVQEALSIVTIAAGKPRRFHTSKETTQTSQESQAFQEFQKFTQKKKKYR